ncbi:hypothetical protein [Clostridium tertium]|uniref:Uncharacterized protein n=1 Tax=Clostridium tertium TaxID=1559 RepID=A0A6N3DW45_9CLOT
MKKSTVLAFIGVVIAFLIVGALGNKKDIYEKQTTFNTPKEAIVNFIGHANVTETVKVDNGYYDKVSRKFLESISRRYRLYIGEDRWSSINSQIPLFFNYELKEISMNDSDFIIEKYEHSLEGIPNYIKPEDIKLFRLDGYGAFISLYKNITPKDDGTFENVFEAKEEPMTLYLVVVNEGEGYVVDYYYVN